MTHRQGMSRRSALRLGLALPLALGGARIITASAQTPEASPAATGIYPEGPLGEQIQWLVETLNGDPANLDPTNLVTHVTTALASSPSAAGLVTKIGALVLVAPLTIENNAIVTTRDFPATNGSFVLVGADGSRTQISLTVDAESGLISDLTIEPAADAATPAASPVANIYPSGALGDQIQWFVETLNGDPANLDPSKLVTHVTPALASSPSAAGLVTKIGALVLVAPLVIENDLIITTLEYPATHASFVLVGADGSRTQIGLTIDAESGLISDLGIEPAEDAATPAA